MIELFTEMVGGIGLFILGMWLLTECLKELATRRLRQAARRWTRNRFSAVAWGVLAGAVTQSMSATTFIVVSIMRSGLITAGGAFALLLGAGIGASFLVLLVTIDIEAVSLFVLGCTGIAVASERLSKYRTISAALLGGATIVLGLTILKDAAAPFAQEPWFMQTLERAGDSLILIFLISAVLTAIVQSSSAVAVFGISLMTTGILSLNEAIMAIYGSFIGSSLVIYMLSINLTGHSRQIAMYMVFYNVAICVILVPLLYCEIHMDIPSMKAAVGFFAEDPARQLALVYLSTAFVPVPFMLLLLGPVTRMFGKFYSTSNLEEMSRTQFIYGHASVDIDTSIVLVDLEQKRVFRMLSQYFEAVRRNDEVVPLRNACRSVLDEISHFLSDLHNLHPAHGIESRNTMMSRHKLLLWMEASVGGMCEGLSELQGREELNKFRTDIIEGVDTVLTILADALESDSEDPWNTATRLIWDRGDYMREVRSQYLELEPALAKMAAMNIMVVTNSVEETFFLMSKVEAEFKSSEQPDR